MRENKDKILKKKKKRVSPFKNKLNDKKTYDELKKFRIMDESYYKEDL